MNETGPGTHDANPGGASRGAGGDCADHRLVHWLLRQKVAAPDRVARHLDRVGLEDRVMPTRRRLTVQNAPGGTAGRRQSRKAPRNRMCAQHAGAGNGGRKGGIAKTGRGHPRPVLIEAVSRYRFRGARLGATAISVLREMVEERT